MASPRHPEPVLLVVAAFSQHASALEWARQRLARAFGPVALIGPTYEFKQTAYYQPTMGTELRKQLLVFRELVTADALAAIKLQTNAMEAELAGRDGYAEPRPLNLDPGILSLGKFMLATTKDQAHRVYLGEGIYAEVTLRYQAGTFEPWPWTYADYRLPDVLLFLQQAREYYRARLQEAE